VVVATLQLKGCDGRRDSPGQERWGRPTSSSTGTNSANGPTTDPTSGTGPGLLGPSASTCAIVSRVICNRDSPLSTSINSAAGPAIGSYRTQRITPTSRPSKIRTHLGTRGEEAPVTVGRRGIAHARNKCSPPVFRAAGLPGISRRGTVPGHHHAPLRSQGPRHDRGPSGGAGVRAGEVIRDQISPALGGTLVNKRKKWTREGYQPHGGMASSLSSLLGTPSFSTGGQRLQPPFTCC
jgi:hypothetical protein